MHAGKGDELCGRRPKRCNTTVKLSTPIEGRTARLFFVHRAKRADPPFDGPTSFPILKFEMASGVHSRDAEFLARDRYSQACLSSNRFVDIQPQGEGR